jgi:Ras-related protein Rab-6A
MTGVTFGVRTCKVVVLGEAQVGKTCLIGRYVRPSICHDEPYKATMGVDFLAKTVHAEASPLRLQIWDTAGDPRYRTLATGYIRDAEAAIVVYDVTKPDSLQGARDWVEIAQDELGDSFFLALVGNKTDLDEERTVTTESGRQLASEMGVQLFVETSNKTGDNVDFLFEKLSIALQEPPAGKPGSMEVPRNLSRPEDPDPPTRCKCWPF